MLHNGASGPEVGLQDRMLLGMLPGRHRNRPSGRPKADFPGSSPAKMQPGGPIPGPETLLRNIESMAWGHRCHQTKFINDARNRRFSTAVRTNSGPGIDSVEGEPSMVSKEWPSEASKQCKFVWLEQDNDVCLFPPSGPRGPRPEEARSPSHNLINRLFAQHVKLYVVAMSKG